MPEQYTLPYELTSEFVGAVMDVEPHKVTQQFLEANVGRGAYWGEIRHVSMSEEQLQRVRAAGIQPANWI